MTNIAEFSIWENGIYQLETEDPALGGVPSIVDGKPVAGHANAQAKQLANRTTYLKTTHETFVSDLADNTDSAKGAELIGYQGGTVADKLGEIVAGAVTPPFVDAAIDVHNHSGVAHPELSAFITSEADRAENAADAAMASGKIYVDTIAGLAATTNGQYFSVPSAESTEYLILYKNNTGSALETKRYPSTSAVSIIQESARTAFSQPNLFSRAQLLAEVMPDSVISGDVSASTVAGLPTIKITAQPGTQARALWRFSRSLFAGDVVSMSMVVASSDAGSSGNYIRLAFRDAANVSIGTSSAPGVSSLAITSPVTYKVEAAAIPENTAYIEVDCAFTANGVTARTTHLRGMYIGSGGSSYYRAPDEVADVLGRVSTLESKLATSYIGNLAILPAAIRTKLNMLGVTLIQDFASASARFVYHERNEAALSGSKTTYYVSATGSNANSGLSRALPKKSIGLLLSSLTPTTDVEVILIGGPSIYYRDDSLAGVTWNQPYHLSIIAETEALITSAEKPSSLSWAANGTAWQATRSGVGNVFDAAQRDYRGVPVRLTRVTSIAEVQASAGTWYTDGVTLYVRTFDSRQPDGNLLALLNTGNFTAIMNSGKTLFLKNVKIAQYVNASHGTKVITSEGNTGYVTAINCAFFGATRNGFETLRVSLAYLRDCTSAHNGYDGFNYHDTLGASQAATVEVGCHAYDNGNIGGTGTNNGSTCHEGMVIARCDGLYYDCYGPVVADVNGCRSININCFSAKSTLPNSGNTRASWYFDDAAASSPGESWLIGCGSTDSQYDIHADALTTMVNVRGWKGASPVLGPNITITRY